MREDILLRPRLDEEGPICPLCRVYLVPPPYPTGNPLVKDSMTWVCPMCQFQIAHTQLISIFGTRRQWSASVVWRARAALNMGKVDVLEAPMPDAPRGRKITLTDHPNGSQEHHGQQANAVGTPRKPLSGSLGESRNRTNGFWEDDGQDLF